MDTIISPRKLKGFQDLLPAVAMLKESIVSELKGFAIRAGFVPIETPTLEYAEVLLGVGGETDKQVFRFMDNGERDVAMRFDLTVPFARFVAEHHGKLAMPLKRFQMGQVYRAEKPQKGRYREFSQFDLDIVGIDASSADIEVMSCFGQMLDAALKRPLVMKIGHRPLVSSLIRSTLGCRAEDEASVLILIDKLEKIGTQAVVESLAALGFNNGQTLIEQLRSPLCDIQAEGIDTALLQATIDTIKASLSHTQIEVVLDLSTVRGLGYYTGFVFETFLSELPEFGSICSGGRYDQLVSRFSKEQISGIGGSVGVDRLLAALSELHAIPNVTNPQTLVLYTSVDLFPYAYSIVSQLRQQQLHSDVFLKQQKLPNQLKWANKQQAEFVIIVGEEERLQQTVNLKLMHKNQELKGISLEAAIDMIRQA